MMEPTRNCNQNDKLTSGFIVCLMLALTGWNILLTINQVAQSQQLSQIQSELKIMCARLNDGNDALDDTKSMKTIYRYRTDNADWSVNHEGGEFDTLSNPSSQMGEQGSSLLMRLRREVGDFTDQGQNHKQESNKKRTKKNKGKRSKGTSGAHFVAHVDQERIQRELAVGQQPRAGNFTIYGFKPSGSIYNMWKPTDYTNTKLFKYSSQSGKVTVQKSGLYLVYAQMMFHGPSVRKSYGIHVNDETVPFIEALAFNHIRNRERRDVGLDPYTDAAATSYANKRVQGSHHVRHDDSKRTYSSYSQCNTLAVTYLKKNDTVFLKSLEISRTVIPKSYLTFWGMARL